MKVVLVLLFVTLVELIEVMLVETVSFQNSKNTFGE